MINIKLSILIYKELQAGKVINKHLYDAIKGTLSPNPLWMELENNYDGENGYKARFNAFGFDLIQKENYAYLSPSNKAANETTDIAIKIQAILIILAHSVKEHGYEFGVLTDAKAGVSEENCPFDTHNKDYSANLAAVDCAKENIYDAVEYYLIPRNLAYKNENGRYVLSEASIAFFQDIFDPILPND